MKVEIELQDLEAIRKENERLKDTIIELNIKIQALNEDELKRNSIILASRMFDSVMSQVFNELGFQDLHPNHTINFLQLEHELGKSWYNADKLEVEIGTKITNKIKAAFIEFSVKK